MRQQRRNATLGFAETGRNLLRHGPNLALSAVAVGLLPHARVEIADGRRSWLRHRLERQRERTFGSGPTCRFSQATCHTGDRADAYQTLFRKHGDMIYAEHTGD